MAKFRDIIEPFITDMMSGIQEASMFGMSLKDVLQLPSALSWGAAVDSGIKTMATVTVMPTASVILMVLSYLELNRTLTLSEADGESRLRQAVVTVVKMLMFIMLLDYTPQILDAITSTVAGIATEADTVMTNTVAEAGEAATTANLDAFLDATESLDWIGKTVLVIVLFFAWLVNRGAVLIGLGLIVIRFVKMMIYSGFAPIGMAFLASSETRHWGMGFLKNYISVALQAFVMVLAFGIYQMISLNFGLDLLSTGNGSITDALAIGTYFMFMGAILGMILAGTGRIANELMGS